MQNSGTVVIPDNEDPPSMKPYSMNDTSGQDDEYSHDEEKQMFAYQRRPRHAVINSIRLRLESYFQESNHPEEEWASFPEIPSAYEIAGIVDGKIENVEVSLSPIKLSEPWSSILEYLKNYYTLMREDVVSTIADVVWEQRANFHQMEENSECNARIYERVYISGICVTAEGVAHLLDFSAGRAKQKVNWASSRRLKPGTLVALTSVQDRFQTQCLVAVVAARPLALLDSDVPSVYVYFRDPEIMEIDTQVEYLMVEASNGYFEACRHTLKALQHMTHESFPLSEHLVHLRKGVQMPKSLEESSHMNINAALVAPVMGWLPNVLEGWPKVKHVNSTTEVNEISGVSESLGDTEASREIQGQSLPATMLDASQFEALRRILTKRLAIIQGPPGTGKTHVSVVALRILLENKKRDSPPIIVTAQTNHALDQLLRHISYYAPEFIRLGSQTTDHDTIEPRTLFRVKERDERKYKELRKKLHSMRKSVNGVVREMRELLRPLTNEEPVDPVVFMENGLITSEQYDSLIRSDETWVGDTVEGGGHAIITWSNDHVQPFQRKPLRVSDDLNTDLENDDESNDAIYEQGVFERDKDETLRGPKIALSPGFTSSRGFYDSKRQITDMLEKLQDLYKVPRTTRGPMYSWLQAQFKLKVRNRIRTLAKSLKGQLKDIKLAKMTLDAAYLKDAPIIGMTTTGLSKYRGLLNSIQPRIVLIEEAAETQEAYVTAACFESLDQLILVGDHQQLRAHCQNKDMERFNLQYSLFERLVQFGKMEFQQLTMQRRMLPEMRQVLNIIYPNLTDHPTVQGRHDIPGMGGRNTWFMTHDTQESVDDHFSYQNSEEAHMVANFYFYLVRNGTARRNITILTFYNGQKRRILSTLRNIDDSIPKASPNVFTVDSYQGEENEVVILSLVRNNMEEKIGFLSVQNRVCVALSRARRGFYMFGNIQLLYRVNATWNKIASIYFSKEKGGRRLGKHLPLVCQKHGDKVEIHSSADWGDNSGGCDKRCGEQLECGHTCPRRCHPQPHEILPCTLPCLKVLSCGHRCGRLCTQGQCQCDKCERNYQAAVKEIREQKEARRAGRTGKAAKLDFLPSDEDDEKEVVLDERLIRIDDSDEAAGPSSTDMLGAQPQIHLDNINDDGALGAQEEELSSPDKPKTNDGASGKESTAKEVRTGLWIGAPSFEAPGNVPLPERKPSAKRPSKKERTAAVRDYKSFSRDSTAKGDRRSQETASKEMQKRTQPSPQTHGRSEPPTTKSPGRVFRKTGPATAKASSRTGKGPQAISERSLPFRTRTVRTEQWQPLKSSTETATDTDEHEDTRSNIESLDQYKGTQISTRTKPTEEELQEEYGATYDLIDIS